LGSETGPPKRGRVPIYVRYSQVGLQFFLAVFLGFLVGRWLDGRFGTSPLLALSGLFLGLVAGVLALYRELFPGGKAPP